MDERVKALDLAVFEWENRSDGLPKAGFPYLYTSYNKNRPDHVYAVMRGLESELQGNKLFKSVEKGKNWANITGNLPNLPFTVLLEHPQNEAIFIAGTDGFGIYKTEDGGQNWARWEEGLPLGAVVTDIDYQTQAIDSVFVVISTYGNGLYKRYLSNNDAVATKDQRQTKWQNFIKNVAYNQGELVLLFNKIPQDIVVLNICNVEGKSVFKTNIKFEQNEYRCAIKGLAVGQYYCSISHRNGLIGTSRFLVIE